MSRRVQAELGAVLDEGDGAWLIGLNAQAHDTGACLVYVDRDSGPQIVANFEEDRLRGEAQCGGFPSRSVEGVRRVMGGIGVGPDEIFAAILPFDFPGVLATGAFGAFSESSGIGVAVRDRSLRRGTRISFGEYGTPATLRRVLGRSTELRVLCVPHHRAHAWHALAASPFCDDGERTLVVTMDALGDSSSTSLYVGDAQQLTLDRENHSLWDSLGFYYAMMASALGGWPLGRGEGRLMGAVAYGTYCRQSNPYYAELRDLLWFDRALGEVLLNRAMAEWPRGGFERPFSPRLARLLGTPIQPDDHWNPDVSLNFDPAGVSAELEQRLDRIAAAQMVFEDAFEHIVTCGLERNACRRVVLTGGAALNCLAVQRFVERNPDVSVWVPPTAGDSGVQMGGAYAFAVDAGARVSDPMPSVFLSGWSPERSEIESAMANRSRATIERDVVDRPGTDRLGEILACLVSSGMIVGLVQGKAETGLRALGNRSMLADPRSIAVRDRINGRIKAREPFRPIAPMLTLEAASRYFVLPAGLSARRFDALRYMTVNLRARPRAYEEIPGVLHADGSARVQVVGENDNPLAHAYLRALGRRIGCEVSVNTSLNVQSPIVYTVQQALDTFERAPALDVLVLVDTDGSAHVVRHEPPGVGVSPRIDDRLSGARWAAAPRP